jgi:choline dehydrogenase-like flavoprotein
VHAVVVGTGPAGTACAKALLRRGVRVTVLDVGEELDQGRQALVGDLASTAPEKWDKLHFARATANPTIASLPIPRKLVFGSDYFYAGNRNYWPTEWSDTPPAASFARGGFSVAWGAAMLPADDCDLAAWPLKRRELEPSYRRVLAELPLSAAHDALAESFPLYRSDFAALKLPQQIAEFQRDLGSIHKTAPLRPFLYGQARLAVRAVDGQVGLGCRYCGICLSGCPIDAIYSTRDEAPRLAALGALEYVPGVVVETVTEDTKGVEVAFFRPRDGTRHRRSFDRAFLGAGAINSTRIVMDSLRLYDQPIRLKDSQKFVLPLLRPRSTPIEWPAINALAGLFVETKLPALSDHWIHCQISTVNDYVLKRFGADPVAGQRLTGRLLQPVLARLMVAWCSLHSDHSSEIELSLKAPTGQTRPVLAVQSVLNPAAPVAVRRVAWAMARVGARLRAFFLPPFARLSPPAAGGHCGGSFPMRAAPDGRASSDLLGRPAGLTRVHLVDASVFPSIPGTTIVLPLMANADRIGTEAPAS